MYNHWQGKNGKWYTYLPKEGVEPPKGKQIQSVSEEKLNANILDYYIKEEQAKKQKNDIPTVDVVYHRWSVVYDKTVGANSRKKRRTNYTRYFEYSEFFTMSIADVTESDIRVFALDTVERLRLCKEACKEMLGHVIGNGGKDGFGGLIRYARREGIISHNPSEFLKYSEFYKHCHASKKDKQPYTKEEQAIFMQGLAHYCKTHWHPAYMPPYALRLAVYLGNRLGELPTLKWPDFDNSFVNINSSEKHDREANEHYDDTTKTGKPRQTPIDDNISELLEQLKRVQNEHGLLCEWVFPDGKGGHINADMIAQCKKRLCKWIGLRDGGVQLLRISYNSDLATAGVPTVIRASLLGHSPKVNEQYYTYDTSSQEEKRQYIQERNNKVRALAG